uniref:Hemicentin-1-like n=1 Tax=Crassostrea virginica TaxID=6565 RepID=A0A8B8EXI0_CRAVI|nr:hemicentin-1-like [Crassostrea virginica]
MGVAFNWTCEMFIPPDQSINAVTFYRNNTRCASIGHLNGNGNCVIVDANPTYIFRCLSEFSYTMTIPAENMTEYEQGSVWRCEYFGDGNFKSPDVTLTIAVDVHNVSLVPSDSPLTLVEGTWIEIRCVVNSNAVPAPIITWYLGSKEITGTTSNNTSSITITGKREDNRRTLQCRATNNNKPPKTVDTTLNVEYPPYVLPLAKQHFIEGKDLVVTCNATQGNPNSTAIFWSKSNDPGFRQTGTTLRLLNIHRNSSGTYKCTAENTYSNGAKGTNSQNMVIDVLYPPSVYTFTQQQIIEGEDLLVTCNATQGNPSSTAIFWSKSNDPGFRQTGTTLRLLNIHRNSSGTYKCTAENTYSNGEKGTNSQNMVIDVLYKPVIKNKTLTIVNNTENAELIREIDSNPLSNISWYDGAVCLDTQTSVKIANLTIKNVSCVDTKNFTLSASNAVQRNVTSMVELIVNCKPEIKDDDITIAITSASRNVSFSTTVIAYPEPRYRLMYKNGTINTEMKVNIYKNAMNNFTIYCEQQFVREMDSETYSLKVDNFLGSSTIFVHISKQEKPSSPIIIESVCEGTSARIKWKASFDGGPVQSFFIVALSDAHQIVGSDTIANKGDNQTYQTVVSFQKSSILYTLYVFAKNNNGVASSEPLICITPKGIQKTSNISNQTWEVAGIVVGVIIVSILVIVLLCFVHRHYILTCQIGIQKRRNKPIESADFTEDKSPYTVIMSEQWDESGRNPYDTLATNESTNQYEAFQMKDNQGSNANTYECLNKAVNINPSTDDHSKDSNTPDTSRKTDAKYFSMQ